MPRQDGGKKGKEGANQFLWGKKTTLVVALVTKEGNRPKGQNKTHCP